MISSKSVGRGEEEPEQNELSRSNKSSGKSALSQEETPLKRAIKENENSIIQSMLSPNVSAGRNPSSGTDWLSPLLDYLFEDGQLTRIEYDLIDKAVGIDSANEQAQALLRTLMETKDDEALEVLLDYLRSNKQDLSTSDTIRKLYTDFVLAKRKTLLQHYQEDVNTSSRSQPATSVSTGIGIREVIEATKRHSLNSMRNRSNQSEDDDRITRVPFRLGLTIEGKIGYKKSHDFYYGRSPMLPIGRKRVQEVSNEREDDPDDDWDGFGYTSFERITGNDRNEKVGQTRQSGKKQEADFRDFYLTNGCLETIRHLIILCCRESVEKESWERLLRNMNGLLSTDVQSIKDLLFNFQSPERRQPHHPILEEEKGKLIEATQDENEALPQSKINQGKGNTSQARDFLFEVNWDQIIYHSFQVWKQRNGLNSTFYSLIGLFQHSHLYQTADFLLAHKASIQARESEKDPEEKGIVDSNGNRIVKRLSSASSTTVMLEKSDFLRKFYSPSKKQNGNGLPLAKPLSTNNERVSVSPVLSIELS